MVIRGQRVTQITLIVLAIAGALAWGYWADWGMSSVSQPIQFPHKKHLALSLTCTVCHQRAEKDAVAGRPPAALCLGCHMGGETKSAEIKKLRAYGEKGQEVPWRRVWRLPSHVFFPHRVHVTVGQLKCQTCHGPMETLDRPPARPLKTLAMDDCIACHEKWTPLKGSAEKVAQLEKVSVRRILKDCNTCHR